ncbi:hypothetical protein [Salipiger sp. PrR002]|uniref:hypothetical protein n=1 Tax=Salipiger sp. PrR002 TaxID=2706489 RepID=UPI0013BCCB4C|nr:hypothetical protein [Salipiger sp. PrR002]NDV99679.1 hypothetical protein [Salipiger sp. PrR002]NDW56723.1 hypothetical protein [Salipiger sp. PrR004]
MSEASQERTHQYDIAHPRDLGTMPGDAGAWDRAVPPQSEGDQGSRGWHSVVMFCGLALVALLIINVFGAAP